MSLKPEAIENETVIHPSAIVHPGAELDVGVWVGPFCVVGPRVKLGKGTKLHSHAVIEGCTTLGAGNEIFPFASVGHAPQDLKYKDEPTELLIGDFNKIREGATLQPGTIQDKGKTIVGSRNLFMAYTHVAHDCVIGDENIFANAAQLAGHVTVGNQVVVGSLVGIHQFCRVGDGAMVGAAAMVNSDHPPFCASQGDRATLRGLNLVGLRRRGFTSDRISKLKAAYKIVFLGGHPTIDLAVAHCRRERLDGDEAVTQFINFVAEAGKRGLVRPSLDERSAD